VKSNGCGEVTGLSTFRTNGTRGFRELVSPSPKAKIQEARKKELKQQRATGWFPTQGKPEGWGLFKKRAWLINGLKECEKEYQSVDELIVKNRGKGLTR